jgi:transposase-like protein
MIEEERARIALEAMRWPDGPICPRCDCSDRVAAVDSKRPRRGLYYCNGCRRQFTVTVGTPCHGSKIPLSKWLRATRFVAGASTAAPVAELATLLDVRTETAKRILGVLGAGLFSRQPASVAQMRDAGPAIKQMPARRQRHEVSALLAVIDALKHLCRGDLKQAEEWRRTAECDIMRGLGMAESDGAWRMPGINRDVPRPEHDAGEHMRLPQDSRRPTQKHDEL